jgi:hypothetical protein
MKCKQYPKKHASTHSSSSLTIYENSQQLEFLYWLISTKPCGQEMYPTSVPGLWNTTFSMYTVHGFENWDEVRWWEECLIQESPLKRRLIMRRPLHHCRVPHWPVDSCDLRLFGRWPMTSDGTAACVWQALTMIDTAIITLDSRQSTVACIWLVEIDDDSVTAIGQANLNSRPGVCMLCARLLHTWHWVTARYSID